MEKAPCRLFVSGPRVTLESPAFAFVLDTGDGLRGLFWENRQTGLRAPLGGGLETEFDLGLPGGPLQTPTLRVVSLPPAATGDTCEAVFELASETPRARVTVAYRWNNQEPVLHKHVTVWNQGDAPWNRLLNVRLGDYRVTGRVHYPAKGERGFPVYLDDEFFLSLAHPAGLAGGEEGKILLWQLPGARVEPGGAFQCMEAVYGAGRAGGARQAFLDHVTRRMRRTVRGHDRPYAIFEPFGARPDGNFDETEEFVLDNIAKVAEGQRQTGLRFDFYSVDFWVDSRGTLKECNPERFPNGLEPIRRELEKLGIALGLWIDSSWTAWSIGDNPTVRSCMNFDPDRPESLRDVPWQRPSFCRATDPIRSLYVDAFRFHIRENGVRLLKFDNLATRCVNPNHAHLPGEYSTEPITDAVIEFLHALDAECPDVFLMLYWGYRSPWWLLHGDTLFESGLEIEAASPSTLPAPHARDSVTHKLDQAQWHASDVPALGKDSLGVWLSSWGWNSSIGKERWQEGFVMDLCRGSLLAQPWSDTPWLSPPEREQIAEFIALLRARPECFRNSRLVVGNPQRNEPYGYCCTDGQRAMIAAHNASWHDAAVTLRLNPDWGLPAGGAWDLYRWYPDRALLRSPEGPIRESAVLSLRPFQVVLLEAVPAGEPPALARSFPERPLRVTFAQASKEVPVSPFLLADDAGGHPEWRVLQPASAAARSGAPLAVREDGSVLAGGQAASHEAYTVTVETDAPRVTGLRLEALPDDTLPHRGPGRAVNGNFCLTEIRVRAHPRGRPDEGRSVTLRNPRADFSQESYGGWPVAAALDGNPATGWSIDPEEGRPHEAVFEFEEPIAFEGGVVLTVDLIQGEREHALGCFRISVTGAANVPAPQRRAPRRTRVSGVLPPVGSDGLLVVTVEMSGREGAPYETRDIGSYFDASGAFADAPAAWEPVLGPRGYPSCWQAWRLAVPAAEAARTFELTVAPRVSAAVALRWRAYFVVE